LQALKLGSVADHPAYAGERQAKKQVMKQAKKQAVSHRPVRQ
jgi:hypothetical protein